MRGFMKAYTLKDISEIVGGILTELEKGVSINGIAPPLLADENKLALALSEEEIENLSHTNARAALVPLGASSELISTIEVERPRLAMMKLLHLFSVPVDFTVGVHPTATVAADVKLGENVAIGANVCIGKGTTIGNNTKILANTYIGKNVKIGENCLFHAGCNIGDFAKIGNRVILQFNASIGADGFSFVTEAPDNIEKAKQEGEIKESNTQQKIYKIPSIGSVELGDDVEIGANTCIDRGTIQDTVIGAHTKIDNLVQIGHNCKIGQACMIVSQVGIAGSCVIGDRVVIAGQAGLADHLKIGNDTIIMAKAGVTKSFPEKSIILGSPAVPRKDFIRQLKVMKQAEELIQQFKKYKPLLEGLNLNTDET